MRLYQWGESAVELVHKGKGTSWVRVARSETLPIGWEGHASTPGLTPLDGTPGARLTALELDVYESTQRQRRMATKSLDMSEVWGA